MSDDKFIDKLKDIKRLRDENKKKVEKIKNVDLEEKKRIINCIVNLEIIDKLYHDGTIFDPRDPDDSELVWHVYGEDLTIPDVIDLLREKLKAAE